MGTHWSAVLLALTGAYRHLLMLNKMGEKAIKKTATKKCRKR